MSKSTAVASLVGRTIHDYKIKELIAEGGMAMIYRAHHRSLGTTKVIKALHPLLASRDDFRSRFFEEARTLASLKHDNILEIDNVGELDGHLWLMMPFLDGESLAAYLRSKGGSVAPHRALYLLAQLCDALDYTHGRGVVHRDIKPDNIYLVPTSNNRYEVKLLDFGIASVAGAAGRGGTPGYMAPEQYDAADSVTHTADVYALGVVTWELLVGAPPWPLTDRETLRRQQRALPSPPPDVVPAGIAKLLLSSVHPDPARRPQSAREFAVAFASELAAVGRVPSGTEILSAVVPRFAVGARSDGNTLRNQAEVDRMIPLLWPMRETVPGPAPRERVSTTYAAATWVRETPPPRRGRWVVSGFAVAAVIAVAATVAAVAMDGGISPWPAAPAAPAAAPTAPVLSSTPAAAPLELGEPADAAPVAVPRTVVEIPSATPAPAPPKAHPVRGAKPGKPSMSRPARDQPAPRPTNRVDPEKTLE